LLIILLVSKTLQPPNYFLSLLLFYGFPHCSNLFAMLPAIATPISVSFTPRTFFGKGFTLTNIGTGFGSACFTRS